ncbi:class I SAM-dependent methyltransferase [Haliangium ochraceum]|uniref:Methyltransferase-like protein n=1 Tax=Haliangium ochraceum (strain DSM 14365 / JCM 11303 / SMP-2) TaxID=502025 RepID=D0LXQ0_HALO1|nr:class I SAM-dependent methyltransferase [Haliangium ochraceum]ACY17805.1 methyltransferase-like protein [Haliangium ochraceum DSM 14365]
MGCSQDKDKAPEEAPQATTEQPAAAEDAGNAAEDEEAKKKEEARQRVAENIAKFEEEAKANAERWNDELRQQVTTLVEGDYKTPKAKLEAVLASEHRTPANAERDDQRHPLDTLMFFEIEPTMTVVDGGSGGGWYTEVLAPFLAKEGKLVAATYDPEGADDDGRTAYGKRFQLFLGQSPEAYGKVEPVYVTDPESLSFGEAGAADRVLFFRELHGATRRGHLDAYMSAAFAALKPGGMMGVVQHRAADDADAEESVKKGYLPEPFVIAAAEKAGFKLAEKSDINANPKDTKDYEKGVWTLPPSLAMDDVDREKYTAIGESDRMTLKFVKPAE